MEKKPKKLFVLSCSFLIMMFSVSAQAGYLDKTGDYMIGSGYMGPGNDYYAYYPLSMGNNNHPIVLFCVGTGGTPENELYKPFLEQYASHGIVVIGSTEEDQNTDNGKTAAEALNWLIAQNTQTGSIFYNKLMANKIVVMGHSQGGAAAVNIANNDVEGVEVPEVSAVVSLMAGAGTWNSNGDPPDFEEIDVPILFVSASLDVIRPPFAILGYYNETTTAQAWYGCHKGTGHLMFPETMQKILRAWLYTYFYDDVDPSAKNLFYGDSWTFQYDSEWKNQQRKNVQ